MSRMPPANGFSPHTLLAPFRRDYAKFLTGAIIRQGLVVLGGYSVVWALRVYTPESRLSVWWLVLALVAFDGLM